MIVFIKNKTPMANAVHFYSFITKMIGRFSSDHLPDTRLTFKNK